MSEYDQQYLRINKKVFMLGLTSDELAVLLCLHSHNFNKECPNEVWPSIDTIRKFSKIGKDKIVPILESLSEAKIIGIYKRKRSRGRDGNLYMLKDWDNVDPFIVKEMADLLIIARKRRKKKLADLRQQLSRNTGQQMSDNTGQRLGFNIGQDMSPNINNNNIINKLITKKP